MENEVKVDEFDVASLKITLDSNNILLNDFFQKGKIKSIELQQQVKLLKKN